MLLFLFIKNRDYKDMVDNSDFVIRIIDIAFLNSRVNNQASLNINNIINAVESSHRIYEFARKRAITKLKNIESKSMKLTMNNIIQFN